MAQWPEIAILVAMRDTNAQFRAVVAVCRRQFEAKARDYGASWTILRTGSILDQIFIKAKRIRTLEETGENKVGDSILSEYQGILNYCTMALMLLEPAPQAAIQASQYQPAVSDLLQWYDAQTELAFETLQKKNHDYGEAWRDMAVPSYTDMILVRVLRMKQILENQGRTEVSEGIASNLIDAFNYAAFALIRLGEAAESTTDTQANN